jgi:30S ribosomal protein S31
MGKGDMKTRRGKLFKGTYGKTRPRNTNKPNVAAPPPAAPKKRTTKK